MARRRRALFAALVPLGLSACSAMLGIEDAHFDAALEGENTAGKPSTAAGASSTGGSLATGGVSGGGTAGKLAASGSDTNQADAGAPGSMGGTGPEASLCDRYCAKVLDSCSGQIEQYSSLNQCLQVCQRLPQGTAGDHDVNSVECRLRQAEFAKSEPLVYCKSSGPLGQDKCGSNCSSYCSLMQLACTAATTAGNLEPSYYVDEKACLAACDALVPGESDPTAYSSSPDAVPSSYVGNNVFCRAYHVAAALDQNAPDEHCPHARGGDPCTSH